jgi:hypothetical protein
LPQQSSLAKVPYADKATVPFWVIYLPLFLYLGKAQG